MSLLAALQPLVATEARTTGFLFSLVLALGLLLGLATPPTGGLPGATWPRISNIIGWTYFSAWSVSFWPQILLNFQRGSVEGLSFDFLLLNLLGFTCYTVYNGALYWNASVGAQCFAATGSRPSIHANDVFFGLHAVVVTALTIAQCCVLRRGPGQSVSLAAAAAAVCIVVGISAYAGACSAPSGCGANGWWNFVLSVSYVKLAISCSKYIPQVFINISRRSTEGWSIHNVLLDFTGGLLSVLQSCGDAQATGDWAGMCVEGGGRRCPCCAARSVRCWAGHCALAPHPWLLARTTTPTPSSPLRAAWAVTQ
jgi:cystinosin